MPTEIHPSVYDITCQDGQQRYRAYLFTEPTPTLVDTGLASTTETLFEGISQVGVEPERVIITHGDGDHVGGLAEVIDRFDVETWVPQQTSLEAPLKPDNRYTDGETIQPFVAVHIPGHSSDNHALIDEAAGVAVLGDALVGADQRGLPAGYFHLPPAYHSEDLGAAEDNIEVLLEYDFDVGLVFHGSSVTTDAGNRLESYIYHP